MENKFKSNSSILKRFLQTEANQQQKEKEKFSDFDSNANNNNNNFMRKKHNNHSMYNYNVKDFLPNTKNTQNKNIIFSNVNNKNLQRRINTCKEEVLSEKTTTKFPISQVQLQSAINTESNLIQQNKNLKEKLKQALQKSKKQQDEIQIMKSQLLKLQNIQTKNLKFWSNKISIQLLPAKKHSYEISVQTENYMKQELQKKPKSLKTKDFQQLYRKFNINSNNPSRTFQKNNSNFGNNYSHVNLNVKNPGNLNRNNNYMNNQQRREVQKNFTNSNDSLFKPVRNVIPDFEAFLNDNKENKRNSDNMSFKTKNQDKLSYQNRDSDQLSISMKNEKTFNFPTKQTLIDLYPIDDDEIQDIIKELMEKQFD